MLTFTNIILIINTALLIYIVVKIEELSRKEHWNDWVEESKREREEEESMVKFHGGLEELLKENPAYVARKQLSRLKALGLRKQEISDFITTFMAASVNGKKAMMENVREYLLATPADKKKILERWVRI